MVSTHTHVDLDVVGEGIQLSPEDLHEHWPQARLQIIDRFSLGEQRMAAMERSDEALQKGLAHMSSKLAEVSEANSLNISMMGATAQRIERKQQTFHEELREAISEEHRRKDWRMVGIVVAICVAAIVSPTVYWTLTR